MYKPITLSSGGAGDSYVAEYFRANPKLNFTDKVSAPLDHISACEYWQVTQESGAQTRNITLYWDVNSCGVVTPDELRIVNYDASAIIWNSTGTGLISGGTSSGIITSTAINQFGYFTLGSITEINPLPVSLIDFNAIEKTNAVQINWSTASEINNNYFEVESSNDAINFQTIGQVSGHGNSTILQNYSLIDSRSLNGIIYYRLKQVDIEGSITLSPIISLTISNHSFADAFPNPFSEKTLINVTSAVDALLEVNIYNASGSEIKRKNFSILKGEFSFDPEEDQEFIAGFYFLKLSMSNSTTFLKLVKQ